MIKKFFNWFWYAHRQDIKTTKGKLILGLSLVFWMIFLTFVQAAFGQTKWYTHATLGDDANGGTSWVDAKLTLSGVQSVLTPNDTLLLRGDFGTQTHSLSDAGIITLDSLFHASGGVNWLTTPSLMDTTKLDWGTEISRVFTSQTDCEWWGIYMDNQSNNSTSGDFDGANTGVYFCRWNWSTAGMEVTADNFEAKFILVDKQKGSSAKWLDLSATADNWVVENCTFISNTGASTTLDVVNPTVASTTSTFKNNLVYHDAAISGGELIDLQSVAEHGNDVNHNVYYTTDAGFPTDMGLAADAVNKNLVDWRTAIQAGSDPDGDDYSYFEDPDLNLGSNYGLPNAGSRAFERTPEGYLRGFYQTAAADTFDGNFNSILGGADYWVSGDSLPTPPWTCDTSIGSQSFTEWSALAANHTHTVSANGVVKGCDKVGTHDVFEWSSDDDSEWFILQDNSGLNKIHIGDHTMVIIFYVGLADPDEAVVLGDNNQNNTDNPWFRVLHDTDGAEDEVLRIDMEDNSGNEVYSLVTANNAYPTQEWKLAIITFDASETTNAATLYDEDGIVVQDDKANPPGTGNAGNAFFLGTSGLLSIRNTNGLDESGTQIHTWAMYDSLASADLIADIQCWYLSIFEAGPACGAAAETPATRENRRSWLRTNRNR